MNPEHLEGKTLEDLQPEARRFLELKKVEINHLTDRLEGRGGGLRTSKPTAESDTGLEQYVWRMARFHSGADPSMPVMAGYWLQDFIDSQGIDASVSGITDQAGKEVDAVLTVAAKVIVARLNGNPDAGRQRWEKALHG